MQGLDYRYPLQLVSPKSFLNSFDMLVGRLVSELESENNTRLAASSRRLLEVEVYAVQAILIWTSRRAELTSVQAEMVGKAKLSSIDVAVLVFSEQHSKSLSWTPE